MTVISTQCPEVAQDPDVLLAKAILRDDEHPDAETILKIAKRLKADHEFAYARRLLGRARWSRQTSDPKLVQKLRQQHALCTYKDTDLATALRLERAEEILTSGDEDLATTDSQETLGIAGAINKRKWELDGDIAHLQRALAYYMKGYKLGPAQDFGYTGINAAFVLDLLASVERSLGTGGWQSPGPAGRQAEARAIRETLVALLSPLLGTDEVAWRALGGWGLLTVAEACLGLGRYDDALLWLTRAAALPEVSPWELESSVRQLATLVRLDEGSAAGTQLSRAESERAFRQFLGGDGARGVESAYVGKVGLALSGGGFRASFFHLGVLAKLAELGVLPHVEVLSCVSGGSIVGAHYYLKLRNLLQTKSDAQLGPDDYTNLVLELIEEFRSGVQRDIRNRVVLNPLTHLGAIVQPDRATRKLGAQFERHLYGNVVGGVPRDGIGLDGLFICPRGSDSLRKFVPNRDNLYRWAKVPVLILNATTLNTGHNWQFTASWMGEPPADTDNPVDRNARLRRVYYGDALPPHDHIRLGEAVAASACVPGLFSPIVLRDLYEEETVKLVDGGVQDNQGAEGLLEQNCSVVIVSDASGQLETKADPSGGLIGVPLRSNSILMGRVRLAQHGDLAARKRSGLLRRFTFLHLKSDLDLETVEWKQSDEPYDARDDLGKTSDRMTSTRYGIGKDVQRLLAEVRTDLDAFCDAEAYALMTSGYLMTHHERGQLSGFPGNVPAPVKWPFLAIEPLMREGDASKQLVEILKAAKERAPRQLHLSRWWRGIAIASAVALAALFLWAAFFWDGAPVLTLRVLGAIVVVSLVASALVATIFGRLGLRASLVRSVFCLVMVPAGFVAFGISYVAGRNYLRRGRVSVDPETGECTIGARQRAAAQVPRPGAVDAGAGADPAG